MTATRRATRPPSLFHAFVGDVPLRDEREAMSLPLVSLSKSKRTKPIEWQSPGGDRWVRVSAPFEIGIATIWDFDVVLWATSQLNEAVERGVEPTRHLTFHPHDLLRAIGRDVGGGDYRDLDAALQRLVGTVIATNVRATGRDRRALFHLLEAYERDADLEGRVKSMSITVPDWLFNAVVKERSVLAIPRDYFGITSGLGRWLYRLARRHAGRQATGWRFTVRELHQRSGSTQPLNQFSRDLRRIIARGNLPEYRVELLEGQTGEPVVSMLHDPAKTGMPQDRRLRRL